MLEYCARSELHPRRVEDVYLIGPSTQIGAKVTHSPSQAFAQEHPWRMPIAITDLGGDSLDIKAAAMPD